MSQTVLYGPFKQVLTMENLPPKGPVSDDQLIVMEQSGILVQDEKIVEIGNYKNLKIQAKALQATLCEISDNSIAIPGLVDAHTHICFAGNRAADYAMRLSGKSYLEIAQKGGGIWSTVSKTRQASEEELFNLTMDKALKLLSLGITTAEVKSGYGLTVEEELKMLCVINKVNQLSDIDLIATCLAAHMLPKDFSGSASEYLKEISEVLLPKVFQLSLAKRVDIFIEKSAFSADESLPYLQRAKKLGFDTVVHADQFSTGGSEVACKVGAQSADHLEASSINEIRMLAKSMVVPVCLPGASLGLGLPFAPARKLLDNGTSLAIASDWNPGSAPMGDLLTQASLLGGYEKLTMAETLAAITLRAADALGLSDRGCLKSGMLADFVVFPTSDYRDLFYLQGAMKPQLVIKKGMPVYKLN